MRAASSNWRISSDRTAHPLPKVRPFSGKPFRVGEFLFRPIAIPHQPDSHNFGFVIHCRQHGARRKVVIMTDFHDWRGLVEECIDSDFIFVNPTTIRNS